MADLISMLAAAAGSGGPTDPYFNQTTLLLHGDGTNGAQNNTFLDGSTNNFTITRNGNTTQGTFSPFSVAEGEWSNYFSGTSVGLENRISGTITAIGTGNFTISFWVYVTDSTTKTQIFCDGSNSVLLQINTSNQLEFYNRVANAFVITGSASTALPTQEWAHIALIRSGTGTDQTKLYINGSEVGSATVSTNFTGTSMSIGSRFATTGTEWFPTLGYISNFIYADSALSSAVPTAPNTNVSGTRLLTCQSNRFVDNSSNAIALTVTSNVRVTPFSPFAPSAAYNPAVNGGSGYFDGTGDYLSIADAAGLRFGTGNFTIQAWIYRSAAGAVHSIAAKGGASTGWVFQVHSDNKLRFTQTTTNIDSTGTIPPGAWTHVAVVREGTGTNQTKLYINGVNDGQATVTTDFNQTEQLNIGADRGNANPMNGYIAGFKYVVGTAETITVPTAPPTGGTALLNFTNAGIFDNTGKNNLETVGNVQLDTTTKVFGTASIEFDGTGDYLDIVSTPPLYLSTGNFTIEGWVYTTNSSTNQSILLRRSAVAARGLAIFINTNVSQKLSFLCGDTDVGSWNVILNSTTSLANNTWYYFAVVRDGNDFELFINGTSESTANSSVVIADDTSLLRIGASDAGASSLNGFIDDLRITKGVARYTSNFTPPTAAFPNE